LWNPKKNEEEYTMTFLEKWPASRDLDKFRHEFDDLLERFGSERGWFKEWETTPVHPAIESYVEGDKFVVRTDLPGVDPKDVDIKVAGGMLTIKGSREEKHETKKADFYRREIKYGAFERSISLPKGMKAEDLKATYSNGVLELRATMPKEAVAKEVKIQIEGAETKRANGEKSAA
jgi:HSP20 family protein